MMNFEPVRDPAADTARRQGLIASFGGRALEDLDLNTLMDEAVRHAADGLHMEHAKILEYRPNHNDLLVRAGLGWQPGVIGHHTLSADPSHPAGYALHTGQGISLPDINKAAGFQCPDLLRDHGVVSVVNVPIKAGSFVWGVLEADGNTEHRFTDEYTHFLQALANLLGSAIRRRKAEDASHAAAARAVAALEHTTDCVIILDRDWRITYLNPNALALLRTKDVGGMLNGDALGTVLWDVLPDTADTVFWHQYHKAMAEQIAVEFTAYYRPLEIWLEIHAYPAPDTLTVFFRDITTRKLAEQALHKSEQLFRTLAEALPHMVWMTRRDGYHEWFNQNWYDFTGTVWDQAKGEGWVEFVHPEDRDRILTRWHHCLHTGEPYEAEYRFRRSADGIYRWFLSRGLPLRDETGMILRWFGTCTDITENVEAHQMLTRAHADQEALVAARTRELVEANRQLARQIEERERVERELDRMFNISVDILGVADFDACFRTVSPAWQTITGHSCAALLHRPLMDFLHPEDRARIKADLERLRRGEPVIDVENRIRHADGSWLWISWRVMPVVEEGLLYCFARDITVRKQAEQALAREAMERRQAEEQLRQAQKMEAVGQLTGGIAHDFNNMLTAITTNLELLQRHLKAGKANDDDSAAAGRFIKGAIAGAERAAALTQRLLAFARRQPLDPHGMDLNQMVCGLIDLLHRTVGETITVKTALSDAVWRIFCDANQMENALLNLVINARDAMPDGGTLTIGTANVELDSAYAARHPEVKPGPYATLSVTDTGTGMTPDVIERAFEPFFTTKPLGQGTGLGLSMIYGFVRQSGGHVHIYSQAGQGTTVTLYLPRLYDDRGKGKTPETIAPRSAAPEPAGGAAGQRSAILLAEDEALVRLSVAQMLRDAGYQVIEAGDGSDALRIVESEATIDLLVTDVGLPGLNGRQLAEAARVKRPGLKVLFTTGYAHNALLGKDALEPGMELLTKPFAMNHLTNKIRAMLA